MYILQQQQQIAGTAELGLKAQPLLSKLLKTKKSAGDKSALRIILYIDSFPECTHTQAV